MITIPEYNAARDPAHHIKYLQGVNTLHDVNHKIIQPVRDFQRVAIRACHGVGKTFTMSKLLLWFMSTHFPCKGLTTAPTNRQVNNLLWSEIRRGHRESKIALGGSVYETPMWKIRDDCFAVGYSPEKEKAESREGESSKSSFQGMHSDNMIIIIDEATGVRPDIWDQIEGMATSGNVKLIAIGNPTTKNCTFYECFQSRLWEKVSLTCFDSPNLRLNGVKNKDDLMREYDKISKMSDHELRHRIATYRIFAPGMLTLNWVMQMALPEEWGIQSIPFQTRILGEWPEIEADCFFPSYIVDEAMGRARKPVTVEGQSYPWQSRYYGIDPARFGDDKTVITVIQDYEQRIRREMAGKDLIQQANVLCEMVNNLQRVPDEKILIDATGIGSGLVDIMKERQQMNIIPQTIHIVEIQFGESPENDSDTIDLREKDKARYKNKKAKIIDLLAKDMQNDLVITQGGEVYQREMPTIIYFYNSKGQMEVESKEDYKKRTGRNSPDSTESFAIANYGRHVKIEKKSDSPLVVFL